MPCTYDTKAAYGIYLKYANREFICTLIVQHDERNGSATAL